MARVLVSTPMPAGPLRALAGHELIAGEPGSDAGAQALICAPMQPVDADALARMSQLLVIGLAGAGSDAVDTSAAAARSIAVLTAGEALVETTADLAFGLMIAAARLMGEGERIVREGRWSGWSFLGDGLGIDVNGATLGLVGFGAIGRAVAARAAAFEMRVLHHTRHETGAPGWVGELDELLAASDIVSLHVPLSDSTRGLIDARRIALMKDTAVIVNTARGAVLDGDAVAAALTDGRLFAAGLDVYEHEPGVSERLLRAPRTVLLPHVGSATRRTREAMIACAAEKVAAFLAAAGQAPQQGS